MFIAFISSKYLFFIINIITFFVPLPPNELAIFFVFEVMNINLWKLIFFYKTWLSSKVWITKNHYKKK